MPETPLPPYRRPVYLAVVAIGGAVGTESRFMITSAVSSVMSAPVITLVINIVGSLLLGLLLESLALSGDDHGVRRRLRLLLGTGFLGGFTTYSTLALDTASYLSGGSWPAGIAYGLGTVLPGVLAAGAGIWLSLRLHRRHTRRRSVGE